ncbi:hypothetical protein Ciccas_010879 [Cichlidogyrus casuarinus]|uniref:Uncharacterized protein n=1 Tax=Cichlidogyrus casuarinus TaxID=1844966 RepID=A0ABD2PUI0_9PLAT
MLQDSLNEAMNDIINIPVACRKHTGIVLLATAGLRAISAALSSRILAEVKKVFLHSAFKPIAPYAAILSGFDEGLYFWLSVNYLQGHLSHGKSRKKTHGTIEMGGGSLQLVTALPAHKAAEVEKITGHKVPSVSHQCDYIEGAPKCQEFVHPMTLKDLLRYGHKYCQNDKLRDNTGKLLNIAFLCQDIAYQHALVESGWQFTNPDFQYTARAEINHQELSWVMGKGLQFAYDQLSDGIVWPKSFTFKFQVLGRFWL